MSDAFLFPGQGSQYAGMGHDLYCSFAAARAVFEEADDRLGFALSACCFADRERGEAQLTRTDVCQLALLVHSTAAFRALGRRAHMVAGHSVGEYSALVACGALSFKDGLETVRLRGQLMAEAGRVRPGTMSAVLGLSEEEAEAACRAAEREGEQVQCANFNAPGQIVISGDVAAVARAEVRARALGARRVVRLKVSGAFHSSLMNTVQHRFAAQVNRVHIDTPACPIYLNTTAAPTTDPTEIRSSMLQQLTSPVRWMQSLRAMQAAGANMFTEIGPGRVLTGLVRRTLGRTMPVATMGTADQIHKSHAN